jgi:hypothetical protein
MEVRRWQQSLVGLKKLADEGDIKKEKKYKSNAVHLNVITSV